jgi:hypothetical protein
MHPRITRLLAHERQRHLIDEAQQARAAAPRRRTRRALLAAVLPAAVAAFVLPAAAGAATTVELSGGTLSYRADTEKTNTVAVRDLAGAVEVRDLRGVTARGVLCVNVDPLTVRCGLGTQRLSALLGDRNDSITIRASFPADIDGGAGEDTYIGAFGPEPTRVRYIGGAGFDAADYVNADRGIRLSNDGVANDGRPGFDQDNIGGDVERLTGTRFGDELTAAGRTGFGQVLRGEQGDDVLRAAPFGARGGGFSQDTFFDMGRTADGADRIIGASGSSVVDYSDRTGPVNVTLNFGGADDGEAGERDEIVGSHEFVRGGQAGDVIRAPAGSTAAHDLSGLGGDDRIEGADGADTLSGGDTAAAFLSRGGDGVDTLLGFGGNDRIEANDGVGDIVGCGAGSDLAELDNRDAFDSCETRSVGVLALTPRAIAAKAGRPVRLRLGWRHPLSWRKLRTVELRLLSQDGVPVGEVTVHPRTQRITADGAVNLVRKGTRLTRKGKTVTARLSVRLDDRLAGQSLKAEVEATDTRGRRQLERDAGTVRVAR